MNRDMLTLLSQNSDVDYGFRRKPSPKAYGHNRFDCRRVLTTDKMLRSKVRLCKTYQSYPLIIIAGLN